MGLDHLNAGVFSATTETSARTRNEFGTDDDGGGSDESVSGPGNFRTFSSSAAARDTTAVLRAAIRSR